MKTKPTLIAMAVSAAFTGSVQSQWIADAGKYEGWQDAKLKQTGVLNAWNRGITGTGVRIAILDSGFDLSHPDLAGQVIAAKNFNSVVTANTKSNTNNFRINIQQGTDITWSLHGTQMASIAAGLDNNLGTVGVAPGAKLLLAQVGQGLTYNSKTAQWTYSSTGISTPGINQALTWAEQNGATVANLSLGSTYDATFKKGVVDLGGGVYKAPTNYGSMYGNRQSDLMNFVNASKNIVITAAAGNDGLPYAQFPGAYATQVDANGRLLLGGRVLIVGSVTENIDSKGKLVDAANPWRMSSFSNRAGSFCTNLVGTTCKDPYYVKDFFVVAPGESIVGAIPTQLKQTNLANPGSGTSQATAYVSGGVALIKQAWPQLTAAQIVDLVKTTATDLGAKGVDEVFGYGLVNFDKATQPQGTLRMAMASPGLVAGQPVVNTGTVNTTGNGISTSSVLKNTMSLDSLGRHYSVDLTKATMVNRVQTYQFGSAWLALSPNNYREVMLPAGQNYAVKMMQTDSGMASQLDYYQGKVVYSVQVGGMTERNGFLGNHGAGALAYGDSNTSYAQLGISRQFVDTSIFAHYGLAVTQTGSVATSMVQFNGNVMSQTWKLGVAENNVIFKDSVRDQVSLSIVNPVTVRRGSATITGVTDYKFTELADGSVSANPVVSSETVSLRPAARPVDLVLGYAVMDRQGSRLAVNVARQFNVAGQAGETATGAGLMFSKFF